MDNEYVKITGYNSRLDTIQALIAKHLLENKLDSITRQRRANAAEYDKLLMNVTEIQLVKRQNEFKEVFHLYIFQAEKRDEFQKRVAIRHKKATLGMLGLTKNHLENIRLLVDEFKRLCSGSESRVDISITVFNLFRS